MKSAIAYTLLAAEAATVLANEKVIQYPFTKVRRQHNKLHKRAGTIAVGLGNAQTLYFVNTTVGTPGQAVQMQLDTGSSDVWMTDSTATFCQQNQYNCQGGTFNPSSSSTYDALSTIFNITYVDGTGSTGNYFKDTIRIGGSTITNQQLGLATDTTIGTGIIGVGFAADEAVCNVAGPCPSYPTIVDNMVSQGLINSHAYSLWLDDYQASTGSILFGGVDSTRYIAPLITLPIERDEYSGTYSSFSVAFTGLTVTRPGQSTTLTPSGYTQQAILDSGTSLTLMPDDLFSDLAQQVGATYNKQVGIYVADCTVANVNASFDFSFGGSGGPVIRVPINEYVVPLIDTNGNQATFSNGKAACEFGMQPAQGDPILFGDTFLRSAYVVYDLDNNEISMANTNFNATGNGNVQAIPSGTSGAPGVSATATGGLAGATYTSNPYLGGSQGTATGGVAGVSATGTGALLTQSISGGSASGTAAASSQGVAAGNVAAGMGSVLGAAFLAVAQLL
jgi:hypothetical protein